MFILKLNQILLCYYYKCYAFGCINFCTVLFRFESKSKFPELGRIYAGKVLNIVDFGCFVQLDMFRQSQGLVHISQLRQKGRVTSVSDVVSRGDKVMVIDNNFIYFNFNLITKNNNYPILTGKSLINK